MRTRASTVAIIGAWIVLACSAASMRAAAPLWLETEQFDQPGGWTADAQFIS